MKAIVYKKYGSPDVLRLEEVLKPVPKENEVLIKVHAASVNAFEWRHLRGDPFFIRLSGAGFLKPKHEILGADVAGRVESVGENVTQFQVGDEVYGENGFGGYAEYVCVRENRMALKPTNVSFEEAAAVPMAALTALQGLRDTGQIQPGQKVLINGASGGVGTFAVQIAKAFGAEVTAVASTNKLEMVRSIGADHVIDYTQEDFTQNGQEYDVILAANGYHPMADYARALTPNGICIVTGGTMPQIFQSMLSGPRATKGSSKKIVTLSTDINKEDLVYMKELLENGKVTPVMDRGFSLSQTADAIRYIEEGHAIGKIVITVSNKEENNE